MAKIHISGFPGSGKTTLGEKLAKEFKKNVYIVETDGFIQHHTKEGKQLLKIQKQIGNRKEVEAEYNKKWRDILTEKIKDSFDETKAPIVILVGSLDNFSLNGKLFWPQVDYKFLLKVELPELLRRYYTRLCEKNLPVNFWKNVAKTNYSITGSEEIVKSVQKYNSLHIQHKYQYKTDVEILAAITQLVKKSNLISS